MSHSSTRAYPGARRPAAYQSGGRLHGAANWLLKAALTAVLGLAGYLFVTEMAVPAMIDGIVGQHQSQN